MFDFFVSDIDRVDLYKRALELWGKESQLFMVIEEMSEAIKEICHLARGRTTPISLANELADAIIMAEQLAVVLYYEAVDLGNYDGNLVAFLGVIDEVYEEVKGEIIGMLSDYDDQQVFARLIRTLRLIMAIADDILLRVADVVADPTDRIRGLIPFLWVMLESTVASVFHKTFQEAGSLPAGRGFMSILVKAGQMKLAYLRFLIEQDEKDDQDESAKE